MINEWQVAKLHQRAKCAVYTVDLYFRGFNWGLHFRWDNVPKAQLKTKEDFIKPIISPTHSGGLFAINKQHFVNLGEYDEGMVSFYE